MRTLVALLVPFILLLAPMTALGAPANSKGLENACSRSDNDRPCDLAGIIRNVTVGPGQTQTYEDGDFTATGTIVVQAGGTVLVDNATLSFASSSHGILVETGGTLRIYESLLQSADKTPQWGLDLAPLSSFTLNLSRVVTGTGIRLATSDADIAGNSLEFMPLALRLQDVEVRIHHNQFLDNTVAVNQTGGANTLDNNTFQGGDVCVRNWLSHPTIVHNTFRGCHTGIFHHRSHSRLSLNDMDDNSDPGGVGIAVVDTQSPTIEGNDIRDYGTGILVQNARAWIWNNDIHHNVGDGVLVVNNSDSMDITGNRIFNNGAAGVRLIDVNNVTVDENQVYDNGGTGIDAMDALLLRLRGNIVSSNNGHGINVWNAPGAIVTGNNATGSLGDGIVLQHANMSSVGGNVAYDNNGTGIAVIFATGASVQENGAHGNAQGFYVAESGGLSINGASAFGNAGNGMFLADLADTSASGLEAFHNGGTGIRLSRAIGTFTAANASHNGEDGFLVTTDLTEALTDISGAIALGNARDGLRHVAGNATLALFGWWEGNLNAGVHNLADQFQLDARVSYWGSPNGPTHADNPEGDGDAVIGDVLYQPYRSSPNRTTAFEDCFQCIG